MRIQDLLESEIDPKTDFITMMKDFLPVAMKELEIDSLPDFKLAKKIHSPSQPTFGAYVNQENRIYIGLEDRHPMDILRTLAHELVHFRQNLRNQLNPDSGRTGSPEENEAHQVAGVIMRHFGKAHPKYFANGAIDLNP